MCAGLEVGGKAAYLNGEAQQVKWDRTVVPESHLRFK